MELDEIIDHHVSAIGGYAAVEGLHGLQVDFHLTEPAFEADGCYTAERKNRMRVDIFANNERIFSEGYDGSSGWQYPQGAKNCLPTSTAGTKVCCMA